MKATIVRRLPLVALTLLVVSASAVPAQNTGALRSDTTSVRSYDGRTASADLIRISVPERRSRPERKITLAALRLKTTAPTPGNPIVFLMGGPGIPGTVMAPIPPYFTLFQRLRELGDVIIVDQRGLGGSEPVLDCPFEATLPADAFSRTNAIVSTAWSQVASCAAQWRAKGADPTAYSSVESADDINDLRWALGADRIDIVAFSYGTRLALAIVQRHGSHVGRVVLQGVNGPGLVIKRPGPVARKLQRLSELLKQDSTWQEPTDMPAAARTARARLGREAVTLTINDRRSGNPVKLSVGREGFDAIVSLNLDDVRLPALLVSVARGYTSVLTRFVEEAWNGLSGGSVGLMARAVNCAADRPRARKQLAEKESVGASFGAPIDNAFLTDDFCRAVGFVTPAVEFPQPVRSSIPVLMLTGGLDATNPIENAHDVAHGLTNATVLEIENAGHEALPIPEVQDVIVRFLSGGDVRGGRPKAPKPRFASVADASRPAAQRR
ncbi:MAG TPA: alpha/beta fold hydrolase [Gemmatimonadaceae bacterium]|nr:alpha/beta fold hydrolase [Gemmatimonadaceae bacterium]